MREIHFLNGSTTFKVLMDGSQLPARRRVSVDLSDEPFLALGQVKSLCDDL